MVSGFSIEDILSKGTSSEHETDKSLVFISHGNRLPMYYSQYCKRSISPSSMTSPVMDDEDDKITRRPRTSITMCQREFLEGEFQKERYPTLAYIDKLSRRIHLPQYVIKVWFQNRRAKYRKEGHRRKRTRVELSSPRKDAKTIDLSHELSSLPWNKQDKIKDTSSYHYPWLRRCSGNEMTSHVDDSRRCSCLNCRDGTSYVQY